MGYARVEKWCLFQVLGAGVVHASLESHYLELTGTLQARTHCDLYCNICALPTIANLSFFSGTRGPLNYIL